MFNRKELTNIISCISHYIAGDQEHIKELSEQLQYFSESKLNEQGGHTTEEIVEDLKGGIKEAHEAVKELETLLNKVVKLRDTMKRWD